MIPVERLDRGKWSEIISWAKERIPEICPQWTDFNEHDPGMALVELLAWFHEIQMFHMDQISGEHEKKFLKLLGVERRKRHPARALVTVASKFPVFLPAGTAFYAGDIRFETRAPQMTGEGMFRRFSTVEGEEEEHLEGEWICEGRDLKIRPFGRVPREGNTFVITLSTPLRERRNWRLYIECLKPERISFQRVDEEAFDGHGFYPPARLELQYYSGGGWRPGKVTVDETWGLVQSGSICFALPEPMDKENPGLRLVLKHSEYLQAPCLTRISLAMVEAWQQESSGSTAEFWGNGFPSQSFDLGDASIDPASLRVRTERIPLPGEKVDGRTEGWRLVEDFHGSGAEDRHFRLEGGRMCFGDGIRGMIPEGRIEVGKIKKTLGSKGNVKAGAVTQIQTKSQKLRDGQIRMVTNEKAALGGGDEETAAQAMERYGKERETGPRAVNAKDYERLVASVPGLLIQSCRVVSVNRELNQVVIVVKPYTEDGEGRLNHAYETNIFRFLEEKRMLGTRIRLVSPEYCRVRIRFEAVARVGAFHGEKGLREDLRSWLEKKSFGEGISYGELYGFLEMHPCIRRVKSLWLDCKKGRRNELGDVAIPAHGLLRLEQAEAVLLTDTKGML